MMGVNRVHTMTGGVFIIMNDDHQVLIDDDTQQYLNEPHFVDLETAFFEDVVAFDTVFKAADQVREIIRFYDDLWASEESLRRAEAGQEEFGDYDPIEDELRAYEETA